MSNNYVNPNFNSQYPYMQNGEYYVYTHSIENVAPVYLGKIQVQMITSYEYNAIWKWVEFTQDMEVDSKSIDNTKQRLEKAKFECSIE